MAQFEKEDLRRLASIGLVSVGVVFMSSNSMAAERVDHPAEMDLCKKKIGEQVHQILEWKWGAFNQFGQRRVRRAKIAFIDKTGRLLSDSVTCTFDELPVGNDFFIGAG